MKKEQILELCEAAFDLLAQNNSLAIVLNDEELAHVHRDSSVASWAEFDQLVVDLARLGNSCIEEGIELDVEIPRPAVNGCPSHLLVNLGRKTKSGAAVWLNIDEEIDNLWIFDKDSEGFLCGGIPNDPSGGNFTHFGPFRDRADAEGVYDEIVRAQAAWAENDYENEKTHWVIQADREADKLVLETVGGLLDN